MSPPVLWRQTHEILHLRSDCLSDRIGPIGGPCARTSLSRRCGDQQPHAASSNLTPPLGGGVIGGFVPFPATHVHDELHARCLVLDDGKTQLALVVLDLLGIHRSVSVEARKLVEQSAGIPPERVLICATHTHSACSALGNRYQPEQPLDEYQQFPLPAGTTAG